MIPKTASELDQLRHASSIAVEIMHQIEERIREGVTTQELEVVAIEGLNKAGAGSSFLQNGIFPHVIMTSVNDEIIGGIPGERKLANGDIISVTIGVNYQEMHSKCTMSYTVGVLNERRIQMIDDTLETLVEGLSHVRNGARLSDISHAMQVYFLEHEYATPLDYSGHGIGKEFHEEPEILNYGLGGRGCILRTGMTFTVEPILLCGKHETELLNNGMTLVTKDHQDACHIGHTIVVTDDGCEILTRL